MPEQSDPVKCLTLPERITALYQQAGLSQAAFAMKIEVTPEVVHRWSAFEDVPYLYELDKVAKQLHVSRRVLCFGSQVSGKALEPDLDSSSALGVMVELGASKAAREAFDEHRGTIAAGYPCTRTYVQMWARAWDSAVHSGHDPQTASARALVIATQANALAKAVVVGARAIQQMPRLPKGMSDRNAAVWIARTVQRLANLRHPIDPEVVAVASGQRLVPCAGSSPAGQLEAKRQKEIGWRPVATVSGQDLIINGLLRVTAWDSETATDIDSVKRLAEAGLQSFTRKDAEDGGFVMALLVSKDPPHTALVRLTKEAIREPDRDWLPGALRDFASRSEAKTIYVVSIAVDPDTKRVCAVLDCEESASSVLGHGRSTWEAEVGDGPGDLGPWSRRPTAIYKNMLPASSYPPNAALMVQ